MFFTLLIVLLVIDFLLFTVWDRYIVSFFGLIVIAVGAYFLLPGFVDFINAHTWQDFVRWAGIYLGVGVAVAGLKWLFFNLRVGRKLREYRVEFEKSYTDVERDGKAKTPADKRKEYLSVISNHNYIIYKQRKHISSSANETEDRMIDELTPHALDYVDRITFWALQWPFAVLSLVFEDILLKLGRWLSEIFENVFTKLSRLLVSNAVKGL